MTKTFAQRNVQLFGLHYASAIQCLANNRLQMVTSAEIPPTRRRSHASCAVTGVVAALLAVCSPAHAEKATLVVTKSDKVGTIRPTWYVSKRVRADIEEKHINQGTEPTNRIREWVQLDVGCPANDDAGHFIARVLGGTGSEHKNIFPENRTVNRGVQSQWEQEVKDYIVSGECTKARVTVSVSFDDNEDPDTRPVQIKYAVRCVVEPQAGGRSSLPTKRWVNTKPANCP